MFVGKVWHELHPHTFRSLFLKQTIAQVDIGVPEFFISRKFISVFMAGIPKILFTG